MVIAVAAAALVGGLAAPASAQTGDATSGAQVGGSGSTPRIECGWALNDADHDWRNGMQYGNDDSPQTNPGLPCQATTNPQGEATMPNPFTTPMIHVKPNAHDQPTQAYVELWGGVTSSVATPIVYWDVFHPGSAGDGTGSFKVQIDGTKYADSSTPARCDGPAGMWVAADASNPSVSTGQMSREAASNMINECKFQQKKLFYGAFGISKHQPWGLYRIVLHAANPGGGEVTLTYYIYVLPFINLEKDFVNVDFGGVLPNQHSWQVGPGGDFIWNGTNDALNQATSVRNTGNAGAGLGAQFTSLCLATAPTGPTGCTDDKRIDHFDMKYGVVLNGMQTIGDVSLATSIPSNLASSAKPAPFGDLVDFDNHRDRTLCPNDIGKIEFSIWTENIQAGNYSGLIRLVARGNAICSTDRGEPYPRNNTGVYVMPPTPTSNSHWPG